jgi:crotonobetainyl-CoA:carnitine CoA-transferase CaiB-like acyl-CoA transferase
MLSKCRVLDLTTERGLLCGQLLGDLGADVIKIEPPGGSAARTLGPFFGDKPDPERSIYWWAYNRNKRAITLNLETDEGRDLLHRLVRGSDFLIESENPGSMAARRLSYPDLSVVNPAIVYVSITPFGQSGPKASYADSDLIIMAASGTLILYGDEDRAPIRMSVPQAYLHACVDAGAAALIAYYERLNSAMGQHIDVAAQESVGLAAQSTPLTTLIHGDETRRMAGGAKMGPVKIPLVWEARDGQVSCVFLFGTALGQFTRKFVDYLYREGACDKAMHETDWIAYGDKLLSGEESLAGYERAKEVVAAFLKTKTKMELFEIARENNFLIAPVATIDDVLQNPQFIAREYWQNIEHPEVGVTLRYPGPFARFSAKPIQFKRRPPAVGEHNHEILVGELGVSETEFRNLERRGII